MRITDEVKMFIGIAAVSAALLSLATYIVTKPVKTYEKSRLVTKEAVSRGPKDAPVYIVEFSDFQCPACKAFAQIIEKILEKYGDKVLFVYRHFPLPQHQYAAYAALAFEAASEQGKGWEMYDYLFLNQENLSESVINEGAKAIGLDVARFEQAMNSKEIKEKVDKDIVEANSLGINSTPTFFLNGQKLNLFSVDDLRKAVDEAIAKK